MPDSLLVELRQASGLTQEELAERTGLSARSIGDLERGATRRPRRASLEALADALGLRDERRASFLAHYRFAGGSAGPINHVPAQLPAGTDGFVGRHHELERLDALLRTGSHVITIEGGAGMGKTELALRWAHRVRADFPDGQLFAALHGFGATPPTGPEQVLEHFLRSLGVQAQEVPVGPEARSALLRTRLADRRMLLVLDDAADSAQVLPLLPGTGGCVALVTSRRRLDGLHTRRGAAPLVLPELNDADSSQVLSRLAVGVDPERHRRAVVLCKGMPLALRLMAAHLARSGADRPPLDLLVASDDPSVGVRALLTWSFRELGEDARRATGALGLLPRPDAHVAVVAAACGWDVARTRVALDELAAVNLLRAQRVDRVLMHDLVHEYAREQAAAWPDTERADAEGRVESLFVAAAVEASQRLGMVGDVIGLPDRTAPDLAGADVHDWMRDERSTVIAVARRAGERGAHDAVRSLSDAWWRHLYKDMRDDDARELHRVAIASADAAHDTSARCNALQYLATIDMRAGRIADARSRLDEVVRIAAELGRPEAEAEATGLLASMHAGIGEYREAIAWAERTLRLTRTTGSLDSEASLLNNLGMLHRKVGDFDVAAESLRAALDKSRRNGDTDTESAALNNLGTLQLDRGDLHGARTHLEAALAAARRARNLEGEGVVLTKLAGLLIASGDTVSARARLDDAARTSETGTGHLRNLVRNGTGDWALAVGDVDAAEQHYLQVLDTDATQDRAEVARARVGLGRVARARGDMATAREYLRRALEEHHALGSPHADDVEAELRALGHG